MCFFFFFKQKTAYEMRISDWSSDVCSSDLDLRLPGAALRRACGELSADRGRPRARPPAAAPAPLPQQAVRAEHRPRAPAPDPPGAAPGLALREAGDLQAEIGSASCRERVYQYV